MNNNKQLTKGNKMKKIAMVIGILSVLATSASAAYWKHIPYSNKSTGWTTQWYSIYKY